MPHYSIIDAHCTVAYLMVNEFVRRTNEALKSHYIFALVPAKTAFRFMRMFELLNPCI